MFAMFSNMATVVFFIALYIYIAADVMVGGSAARLPSQALVPSLAAAVGFRILAWLVAPRASVNPRRAQLQRMLRARR